MVCFRDRIAADQAGNAAGRNVLDSLKHLSVPELQEVQRQDSVPIHAAFLNVEGDLNVSVMVRTACLQGLAAAHVIGRRKYDPRGLVGAQNYIPVHRHNALNETRDTLDIEKIFQVFVSEGLSPIFMEHGGLMLGKTATREALTTAVKETLKSQLIPTIVMGNEATGIPTGLIDLCRAHIPSTLTLSIPQKGVLRSYNVSAAFAIAVHEITNLEEFQ